MYKVPLVINPPNVNLLIYWFLLFTLVPAVCLFSGFCLLNRTIINRRNHLCRAIVGFFVQLFEVTSIALAGDEFVVAGRVAGSGRVEAVVVPVARTCPVAVRTSRARHSAHVLEASHGRFGSTACRCRYDLTYSADGASQKKIVLPVPSRCVCNCLNNTS